MRIFTSLLFLTVALPSMTLFSGCVSAVERRQAAISGIHDTTVDRRSTRVDARDERMWQSREVWFQD